MPSIQFASEKPVCGVCGAKFPLRIVARVPGRYPLPAQGQGNLGVLGFSNNVGVYGETTNPAGNYAGVFRGNIVVTGTKSAAVPFPDGTQRVLYCMESPELWFEDFGTAKLKRGRVVVKLNADFGKVIESGDYRVFVTPEGDCRGLYVHRKSASTFEVRELTGGKSSIAFSYRIVGRRKDIKEYRRFAKAHTLHA
jgi:hypothetical protein